MIVVQRRLMEVSDVIDTDPSKVTDCYKIRTIAENLDICVTAYSLLLNLWSISEETLGIIPTNELVSNIPNTIGTLNVANTTEVMEFLKAFFTSIEMLKKYAHYGNRNDAVPTPELLDLRRRFREAIDAALTVDERNGLYGNPVEANYESVYNDRDGSWMNYFYDCRLANYPRLKTKESVLGMIDPDLVEEMKKDAGYRDSYITTVIIGGLKTNLTNRAASIMSVKNAMRRLTPGNLRKLTPAEWIHYEGPKPGFTNVVTVPVSFERIEDRLSYKSGFPVNQNLIEDYVNEGVSYKTIRFPSLDNVNLLDVDYRWDGETYIVVTGPLSGEVTRTQLLSREDNFTQRFVLRPKVVYQEVPKWTMLFNNTGDYSLVMGEGRMPMYMEPKITGFTLEKYRNLFPNRNDVQMTTYGGGPGRTWKEVTDPMTYIPSVEEGSYDKAGRAMTVEEIFADGPIKASLNLVVNVVPKKIKVTFNTDKFTYNEGFETVQYADYIDINGAKLTNITLPTSIMYSGRDAMGVNNDYFRVSTGGNDIVVARRDQMSSVKRLSNIKITPDINYLYKTPDVLDVSSYINSGVVVFKDNGDIESYNNLSKEFGSFLFNQRYKRMRFSLTRNGQFIIVHAKSPNSLQDEFIAIKPYGTPVAFKYSNLEDTNAVAKPLNGDNITMYNNINVPSNVFDKSIHIVVSIIRDEIVFQVVGAGIVGAEFSYKKWFGVKWDKLKTLMGSNVATNGFNTLGIVSENVASTPGNKNILSNCLLCIEENLFKQQVGIVD